MWSEHHQDISLCLGTCLLLAPVTLSFELIPPGPDFSLPSFRFPNVLLPPPPTLPPPPPWHIFNLTADSAKHSDDTPPQPAPPTATSLACNLKEGANKALPPLFRFLPGAAPVFFYFFNTSAKVHRRAK